MRNRIVGVLGAVTMLLTLVLPASADEHRPDEPDPWGYAVSVDQETCSITIHPSGKTAYYSDSTKPVPRSGGPLHTPDQVKLTFPYATYPDGGWVDVSLVKHDPGTDDGEKETKRFSVEACPDTTTTTGGATTTTGAATTTTQPGDTTTSSPDSTTTTAAATTTLPPDTTTSVPVTTLPPETTVPPDTTATTLPAPEPETPETEDCPEGMERNDKGECELADTGASDWWPLIAASGLGLLVLGAAAVFGEWYMRRRRTA